MIELAQTPEPQHFDAQVRRPGNRLLARRIPTSSKQFNNYWKQIGHDLHTSYGGICAYTCMYMMPPGTVDHFFPKTQYPHHAYEWSNYRLATQKANQHKGDSTEVIDPFNVRPGWFVLDFPSCLVLPGSGLSDVVVAQIERTIKILKLNDDDVLVQERSDIMLMYADGEIEIGFLRKRYPFLALEIVRQGIEGTANQIFRRRNQ